ncbi:MAG: Gfo/Idh/MocA family oxidoreductase [Prolixibacteraceae bacterium]|jgi:predicted dehydrogenase|nr:Gfo/Idh/MocA family oxidoreductase [Prolixibacteraceae bacterium]MBT6764673.1 Gfo/Idh/MocA family oxidoreductase [Prolixibacteraceae bacterium]MBT7000412.1 Gfo/Idh/MocA family oxidoreductase [Prolixibacteraceae bacterium]MBT7395779.1 Gfo/Idh/MocA family oxidoreductase [Prolixibacteraceae bacterium]
MKIILICIVVTSVFFSSLHAQKPVKIGVAGLSHSHVVPLLRNMDRNDIEIVGIAERDTALSNRYAKRFGIDQNLIYQSLDEMLEKTKPEGVITFTSIYEHLKVVEACAPLGIHVMVEKPLAVSVKHAKRMAELANKHGILLLTNYETTWYPSNYAGFEMINNGELGDLRKIIVYDGHKGPKEIGVNNEFLEWLTDPVLNGGGAVIDFGCYGADIITWILKGQKPLSVYAELKQYKPNVYPKVDDDATIILSYPNMEGVLHASWNWPFNRKDMHVYGNTGYIYIDDAETIRYRLDEKSKESTIKIPLAKAPFNDPFTFFASAINGETKVTPTDLSSLEINLTVVEILDAARESNKTGKKIKLNK